MGGVDRPIPETVRDRPELRAANQLCPQLIERGRADQTDPGRVANRSALGSGSATRTRLRGGPARQLVTG